MGLPRQTDTAALRVLRITELLFGNVLDGFSNKEIADALGYSPQQCLPRHGTAAAGGLGTQAGFGPLGRHGKARVPHAGLYLLHG